MFVVSPWQIVTALGLVSVIVGKALIVTFIVSTAEHKLAFVTVTEYIPVEVTIKV